MPIRPAVPGLLKHQLMFSQHASMSSVTTIWTYKNAYPVAQQRVDDERARIEGWLTSHWRHAVGVQVTADRIKTWDFGTSPPTKYPDDLVWPVVTGQSGNAFLHQLCAVVALRSEPVGSIVKNRLNGRIYHPLSSTHISLNTNAQVNNGANITAAYTQLIALLDPAADADVGDWVVPSFFNAGAVRPVPLMIPIDHVILRGQIGTQRRRLSKAGAYARGA